MRQIGLFTLCFALCATMTAAAQAQQEGEETIGLGDDELVTEDTSRQGEVAETGFGDFPKAYAARPLVLDKYMFRGTFGINTKKFAPNTDAVVSLDFGAAFSPLENLEIGLSNYRTGASPPMPGQGMFPIIVNPEGEFGDITIYGRYQFWEIGPAAFGADLVLNLPSNTEFSMLLGVPVRIRTRDKLTIDTGLNFVILTDNAGLNIELPVKVTFNITDAGFVFGSSGFDFQNLGRDSRAGTPATAFPVDDNQVWIPLYIGGGYTLGIKDKVLMDFFAQGGFEPFIYLNSPDGIDAVPAGDAWYVGVGVNVTTRPLIK